MLAYKNPASNQDLIEFNEWGNMMPRSWFNKNILRFYFELEDIVGARKSVKECWDSVPFGTGIYLLFKDSDLQYIGQARRIADRLDQHIRWDMHDITHYVAIWVPDTFMSEVEYDYINHYKPPRNLKYLYIPKWPL